MIVRARVFAEVLILIALAVIPISLGILWNSMVFHSSGTITHGTIIDKYSEGNYDATVVIGTLHPSNIWAEDSAQSQSFMGTASRIIGAEFYIRRYGTPSGQLHAVLYSHYGSFDVNGTPSNELARSDPVESSTLSTVYSLVYFAFSGTQQVVLAANIPYSIVLEGPTSGFFDSANSVQVGADGMSPSHAGNYARFRYSTWWSMNNVDLIFYIYGNSVTTATIHGRIMDSDGTTPFDGANAELVGYSKSMTGSDGVYSFDLIPARLYTLRVRAAGYQTLERIVDATTGGDLPVSDLHLIALPRVRVYGYVKYINSSPAVGVTVNLTGDITYVETTATDGLYDFPSVPQGDYQLLIFVSGYRQLGTRALQANVDTRKNVTLVRRSTIGGKIPIRADGQVYHMAFCSWGDTASPLPEAASQDIDRFVSITGKSLYGAENAGTIDVGEDFWPMRQPNSWKPLLDDGLFEVFIFSLNPYLRAYPSDSDSVNGPTAIEWKIANGDYDAWINTLAQEAKDFQYPVMLKIGAEMNGNQGPNGPGSWIADFGATPQAFTAAWRRIVDVFAAANVTNVDWCISYNFESVGIYSFEDYYPGDDYVDWIGVDYYQINAPDKPSSQVAAFYSWAVLKNKPLAVTEWGTNWYNKNIPDADRARYINDFFNDLETRPRFKMIRYHWNSWWRFQDDNPSDYAYMPLASAAYRNRIANDRYLAYIP